MRLVMLTLLALTLSQTSPARADEPADAPKPHHHRRGWYSGWTLVIAGGATALVGVALTPRTEPAAPAAGWTLAGVGTASWVAGALILKLSDWHARE